MRATLSFATLRPCRSCRSLQQRGSVATCLAATRSSFAIGPVNCRIELSASRTQVIHLQPVTALTRRWKRFPAQQPRRLGLSARIRHRLVGVDRRMIVVGVSRPSGDTCDSTVIGGPVTTLRQP
ncbi:MAG: hypothetical protein JWM76_3840 [Pseudonocardiales bacterium]|nr:hypothetical protein [Pseudonocardiales bacterium]